MTYAATLAELPLHAAIELRGDRDGIAAAIAAARLGLPRAPNTMWRDGDRRVLWIGPDNWLIMAPPGQEAALFTALDAAIGRAGSVVILSDSLRSFSLAGAEAADVLAQGCAVDLDQRCFGPDSCTCTALAKVAIVLVRTENGFETVVDRSYQGYLRSWIARAIGA
jgi:sarcosine oxidase subunit gamma